jgi:anaerobic magnesium-protoporphyrin IX monomethyl ester cyclase
LGLLYISSYLENNGFPNDVFDTTFSSKGALYAHLTSAKPRVVGIYVNLMTKVNVLELITFCRKNLPMTTVVLGGPEVRYNAENFLRHGAHFCIVGEGEETMKELCDLVINNRGDMSIINGIAFLSGSGFVQNGEREKLKDLDDLVPAREKIDLTRYLVAWKAAHGKNTLSVSTMRGCPYTCKWCSRAVYGLSYRRRSAARVVEELAKVIRDYNPDSLWFVDDVFTISHKWLREFADELKRQDVKISYECITRADRMNEDVIRLLESTGCFRVWIGAESGSQKVIDLMDRRVKVGQVREMIKLSRTYGIETGTFIMLGYPGETEQDIEETILHLKDSNPDHFTITIAYPIKGTDLFGEVEALQTKSLEWSTSSDRDIDFKRMYNRRYYDFAVRRVVNEVHFAKAAADTQPVTAAKFKAKSIVAKLGMLLYKHV